MGDSSRTPLLRQPSSQSSESIPKSLFHRLTHPVIFTGHNLAVASGPLATLCTFIFAKYHGFADAAGKDSAKQIGAMLGALVWMAMWWILEPVPIAVTALLPLVLFPFFEIMESEAVASEYMNDNVVLMLGTFILALAINKYDLHKRMALKILLLAGGQKMNPRLVLLGFMVGPAFVSMWMSNVTAAAMMVPMATGLLHNLEPGNHEEIKAREAEDGQAGANDKRGEVVEEAAEDVDAEEAIFKYSQGVVLGVIYGIGLGGLATLIGSGPTLVLPGMYSSRFPDAPEVTFLMWSKFALPLCIVWLICLWLFLSWRYCPARSVPVIEASLNRDMVEQAYHSLGPIGFADTFVFAEFCIIVLLWITRSFGQSPGWGAIFNDFPNDGTVAIAAAILLFVIPDRKKEGEMLMDWKTCKGIQWNVILLVGGGFALSKGIQESGVSDWISLNLQFFDEVPYLLLTPIAALILSVVTEFSSNVAICTLFLPIFAEVAISNNYHPLLLMVPTVFASSYAFILPSGTPCNAIAFGTGYLNVHHMGTPGLFMHVFGIVILSMLTPTLGAYVFGLNQPASSLPWLFS